MTNLVYTCLYHPPALNELCRVDIRLATILVRVQVVYCYMDSQWFVFQPSPLFKETKYDNLQKAATWFAYKDQIPKLFRLFYD